MSEYHDLPQFWVGQRVKLSVDGLAQHLQGHAKRPTGTVRRVDDSQPLRVWVQRDGLKGTDSYHRIFWVPINWAKSEKP